MGFSVFRPEGTQMVYGSKWPKSIGLKSRKLRLVFSKPQPIWPTWPTENVAVASGGLQFIPCNCAALYIIFKGFSSFAVHGEFQEWACNRMLSHASGLSRSMIIIPGG